MGAIDSIIKALQNDGRDNEICPGTNLRPVAERIIATLFEDGCAVVSQRSQMIAVMSRAIGTIPFSPAGVDKFEEEAAEAAFDALLAAATEERKAWTSTT